MNTNLQVFNNTEFGDVRVLEVNDEVWFVGKEIAELLGYKNTRDALSKHVDVEDKKTLKFRDCREMRLSNLWKEKDFTNKVIINESGLYSLILSSKLPTAKNFKHWVTSEILPSIRKTGSYTILNNKEECKKELAYQLLIGGIDSVEAHKKLLEIETRPLLEKIEEDKPMVALAEVRLDKGNSISLTDVTKSLGLKRGQITKWAKYNGYIHKANKNEVNKKGEKYFKVYEHKGFRCVGVLEEGLQLINKHIEEIKEM